MFEEEEEVREYEEWSEKVGKMEKLMISVEDDRRVVLREYEAKMKTERDLKKTNKEEEKKIQQLLERYNSTIIAKDERGLYSHVKKKLQDEMSGKSAASITRRMVKTAVAVAVEVVVRATCGAGRENDGKRKR